MLKLGMRCILMIRRVVMSINILNSLIVIWLDRCTRNNSNNDDNNDSDNDNDNDNDDDDDDDDNDDTDDDDDDDDKLL